MIHGIEAALDPFKGIFEEVDVVQRQATQGHRGYIDKK